MRNKETYETGVFPRNKPIENESGDDEQFEREG